jgi:sugar phosphate isomerase/epimerase
VYQHSLTAPTLAIKVFTVPSESLTTVPEFVYGLNTSTIKPAALLEKIRIAAETGYRAIELWHEDLEVYLRDGGSLADVRRALDDGGLTVATTIYVKGWFESTGEAYQQALEQCRRRMDQAAAVGAGHIIAGPPAVHADRDLGAAHYRELLALGREYGVRPAMEFLGFVEDIKTIDDAWEIITQAGDPDGTIVLDPFHIFRGGGSMERIGSLPGDRIAVCHFNDAPASPPREQQHDRHRVYPGDGHLDLRGMIRQLRATGYRGCVSLELFNEALWAREPREVAATGLEKMRAVIEE